MKLKLTVIALIFALTGAPSPIASAADAKNPYGTATIDPAGSNEIILTVRKGNRKAEFLYSRLLKFKEEEISIYEPFLKRRQSFSVIPLEKLFSFVGISRKDKVLTTALNDYTFTATATQFIAAGAYLAIKRDGSEIGYDQGGPIRIIYSDKSKWAKNLDAWNWSLASISVK